MDEIHNADPHKKIIMLELRGKLDKNTSLYLGILGVVLFIAVWWGLAESFATYKSPEDMVLAGLVDSTALDSLKKVNAMGQKVYPLLPRPDKVFKSYASLWQDDQLWHHTLRSIWLNLKGYFWAIIIAIPLGFVIGLFPVFRGLFSKQVDALRYLPLSALTGLFIIWFGIEDQMKIAFLAFGILVYLLPVVVQRIDEVDDVYVKTLHTLGARNWDTIKQVFIPAVGSKLIDDIRVLTAISWTYIIIAELLNRAGGIGSLIFTKARQGQIDKVFAVLIVIVLIGFIQDRVFAYMDKRLYPHKYETIKTKSNGDIQIGILLLLGFGVLKIMQEIFWSAGSEIFNPIVWIGCVGALLYILYGEFVSKKIVKNV
jgi:NitT/TauT family transport system permease protein